jgi:hypothetical protein
MADRLTALLAPEAEKRKGTRTDLGKNFPKVGGGRTREKVAPAVGMSHPTPSRAPTLAAHTNGQLPRIAALALRTPARSAQIARLSHVRLDAKCGHEQPRWITLQAKVTVTIRDPIALAGAAFFTWGAVRAYRSGGFGEPAFQGVTAAALALAVLAFAGNPW